MNTSDILDAIDTQDFLLGPVAIASGCGTVKNGFLGTPEVQALLAAQDAVPAMLARLSTSGGIVNQSTLIVYFTVFEQLIDPNALNALNQYMSTSSSVQDGTAGLPSDPYQYASDAAQTITAAYPTAGPPAQPPAPGQSGAA